MAHTAQFARPGWQYLDSASGFFSADTTGAHGSYVALRSPDRKDFSLIIETVQAKRRDRPLQPRRLPPAQAASLDHRPHLQRSRAVVRQTARHRRHQRQILPRPTTRPHGYRHNHHRPGQGRRGPARRRALQPSLRRRLQVLPDRPAGKVLLRHVRRLETAPCDGGRTGICLSQLVPREPIAWKRTDNRPFTILGNLDWTDYTVSTDVLFEQPGSADLIGRLTGMSGADIPNSYVLRVADTGAWSLRRTSTDAGQAHPAERPRPRRRLNRSARRQAMAPPLARLQRQLNRAADRRQARHDLRQANERCHRPHLRKGHGRPRRAQLLPHPVRQLPASRQHRNQPL